MMNHKSIMTDHKRRNLWLLVQLPIDRSSISDNEWVVESPLDIVATWPPPPPPAATPSPQLSLTPLPTVPTFLLMNNVLFAMVRASRGRGGESCWWGLSQARAPTRSTLELWLQVAFRSTKPPSGGATAEFRPGSETSKQQLEELGDVAMLCQIGETVESETGNILDFYTLVIESQVERQQILFEPFQLEEDRLPIL